MSRRPLKVYMRDENKVFRAIEGITYSEVLLFINKSVYTMARTEYDNPVSYVFEKVS